MWGNIHLLLLHFIYFSSLWNLSLTSPVNSPDFLSFFFPPCFNAHVGTLGFMPVVLWPWPGGVSSKVLFHLPLQKLGVLSRTGRMNSWRVGGQRGPGRGQRGQGHSKPLLPAQRYTGWKRIMLLEQKKGSCFPCRAQRTQQTRLQTTTLSFSCHVIAFLFSCTAAGIITFVQQRCNNIWCLFLINHSSVCVHLWSCFQRHIILGCGVFIFHIYDAHIGRGRSQ